MIGEVGVPMFSFLLAAGLSNVVCPNWVPGTNEIMPEGIELSKPLKLKNKLRCYCEVVIPAEETCKRNHDVEMCRARTASWVEKNFPEMLSPYRRVVDVPQRMRMMSIEP